MTDNEPERPEYLETVEDYKNAPVGTVVCTQDLLTVIKKREDRWETSFSRLRDNDIPDHAGKSRVLRWGWGK